MKRLIASLMLLGTLGFAGVALSQESLPAEAIENIEAVMAVMAPVEAAVEAAPEEVAAEPAPDKGDTAG